MFSSSRQLRTKEDKFRHKIRRPVDTDRLSCVRWMALTFFWRACFNFFLKKKFPLWSWVPFRLLRKKKKEPFRFLFNLGLLKWQGGLLVSIQKFYRHHTATTSPAPTTSSRKFEKVKYPQRWAAYSSLGGKIRPSIRWEQKRSERKRKTPIRVSIPCKYSYIACNWLELKVLNEVKLVKIRLLLNAEGSWWLLAGKCYLLYLFW